MLSMKLKYWSHTAHSWLSILTYYMVNKSRLTTLLLFYLKHGEYDETIDLKITHVVILRCMDKTHRVFLTVTIYTNPYWSYYNCNLCVPYHAEVPQSHKGIHLHAYDQPVQPTYNNLHIIPRTFFSHISYFILYSRVLAHT